MTTPTLTFLSTGCNRDPNALHWLHDSVDPALYPQGLIAYAAASLIAIYDPAQQIIVATLRGHTQKVNGVQWIRNANTTNSATSSSSSILRLVSCSVDKSLIVWSYNPLTRDYTLDGRLLGHEDGVAAVTAMRISEPGRDAYDLIASASSDLTVRIWMHTSSSSSITPDEPALSPEAGGWHCTQVLSTGRHKIMHCLDLAYLPLPAPAASSASSPSSSSLLILSVGGVDSKIHLWLASASSSSSSSVNFLSAVSLSGHENWIRSLEWTQLDQEKEGMQRTGNEFGDSSAVSAPPLVSFMLASASQDRHIRLWKLQVGLDSDSAASSASSSSVTCTSLGSRGHILSYGGFSLLLVLESVLSGHDNWVMCARWQPPVVKDNKRHQPLCLLSASADKTMCIWRPSASTSSSKASSSSSSGVWHSEVKVGVMGGHTLGFYGCAFSPSGDAIIANGYSGSIHLWRCTPGTDEWLPSVTVSGHAGSVNDLCWDAREDYLLSTSSDQSTRLWAQWLEHRVETPAIASGAAAAASSSSTSTALTTLRPTWHETARPQLHGYDLTCLCPLYSPSGKRAHAIASGADEKVMRVFWAPRPFLETIKRIAGVETKEVESGEGEERPLFAPIVDEVRTLEGGNGGGEDEDGGEEYKSPVPVASPTAAAATSSSSTKGGNAEQLAFLDSTNSRAIKANLPELGLSNKGLMSGEAANTLRGMQHVSHVVSTNDALGLSVNKPPPEDYLLSTTLWPEIEKLYGHGYEIVSIACSYSGELLVSACISKQAQHAVIRVWQTKEWSEILSLPGHRSSVVSLAFSPDDRYLLSASKDRHISVFELGTDQATNKTTLLGSHKLKAHARIVWCVSWAPLYSQYYFASASRDKLVKTYRVTGEMGSPVIVEDCVLPAFSCPVTTVTFLPCAPRTDSDAPIISPSSASTTPRLTMAIGLEDGRIELWRSDAQYTNEPSKKMTFSKLYAFPANVCHGGFVKRIACRWRARTGEDPSASEIELASCSNDQSVRIFAIPAKLVLQ